MPSHPAQFLAGETRQVWALRRDTGTPVYLPVGQANALRAETKTDFRCLYPGCDSVLSTRGGMKRDHFFHVGTVPHETGRESENHLAAKAMIAQWLRNHVPAGATVVEEQTVKNPHTALHRRPDIVATGAAGRRIAYEVEYKSWPVAQWEAKQDDLDREEIPCLWLIGHTRIRLVADTFNAVRVPQIVAAMARRKVPVLVINPERRELGTLSDPHSDERRYDGDSNWARLHVDALDDCGFSPTRGIRTPTLLVIEEAEQRRAAINAERARQRRAWQEAWRDSPVRAAFATRWSEVPEALFGGFVGEQWNETTPDIGAVEKHWRGAIYEDRVLRGVPFRIGHMLATLEAHGIEFDRGQAGAAIGAFIQHLVEIGLVTKRAVDGAHGRTIEMTPTGRTLDDVSPDAPTTQRRWPLRESHLDDIRRTKPITLPNGSVRWVPK